MGYRLIWGIILAVFIITSSGTGDTSVFTPALSKRKLKVVRTYEILSAPGLPLTAEIPAMFSFQGATNEQLIDSCSFTFSQKPDTIEVSSHEYGWARKIYRMGWKKTEGISVTVRQELIITLIARNKMCTAAKLPYPASVGEKFKDYLGPGRKGDINPENPALPVICEEIAQKSRYAEEAVAGVCDWIADKIQWVKGAGASSDKALSARSGNSYAMSCLACAMLRKMKIPCDVVMSKYLGGDSSYYFIEVYFPDAGWVFYDLACPERGVKTLDCVAGSGWSFLSYNPSDTKRNWTEGYFFDEWDIAKYKEPQPAGNKPLRNTPLKKKALSVMVAHAAVPANLPVRQEPLRAMLLNKEIQPPAVKEKATATDDTTPLEKVKNNKKKE